VRMKSLHFFGLMALAAVALHGQPTNGAQYWSTTVPDCSSLGENAVTITNAAGATVGYSCFVSGTFLWLAAGGPTPGSWSTEIRVAAPASGAIGVDYTFYDPSGNNLSLDTTISGGSVFPASGNDVNFALFANQPSDLRLLGATSNAPHYGTTATGSVYAVFYCPDVTTCETVLPQLLYSFLPTQPWSLSVPISWDTFWSPVQAQGAWTQWSATGVNDATHFASFVVYNQDTTATSYAVRVYDGSGNLAGSGTTPSIAPIPVFSDGTVGQGGTYGALLSQVITTGSVPTGVFKVTVDGGTFYSAVSVLQFNGPSAASLQVGYDTASTTTTIATSAVQTIRRSHVANTPKRVFSTLPR